MSFVRVCAGRDGGDSEASRDRTTLSRSMVRLKRSFPFVVPVPGSGASSARAANLADGVDESLVLLQE
jgi:hypothetical protein